MDIVPDKLFQMQWYGYGALMSFKRRKQDWREWLRPVLSGLQLCNFRIGGDLKNS